MNITNKSMHEDIVDHVAYDKGYNIGLEAGKKAAWDLIGEVVKCYKHQLNIPDQGPGFRKRYNKRVGRYEAALYAQMVVKKGSL
tara:strand:+ start:942 stop:1193 length:252 start_codon:yes stop_codon:yes gene_type:complete